MQAGIVVLAFLLFPPAWRALKARLQPAPLALAAMVAAGVLALALAGETYASERTRLLRLFHQPSGAAIRLDVSDAITLGDPSTPLSVLLFFDFGCPHCYQCWQSATYLVERYPSKVHFLFKNYPLDRDCNAELSVTAHPSSCRAAAAGTAAARLGRSADGLKYLFGLRDRGFTRDNIAEVGRKLDVPAEEWDALLASRDTTDLVARDVAEGNRLGLKGVPVTYINGRYADPQRLVETVERLSSPR
jgi:protein-disulfide isomerase